MQPAVKPIPRAARPAIAVLVGLVFLGAALSSARAAPHAGSYDAELCVATSNAVRSCGPAEVELQASGAARVRVSDLVYRLRLNSSQVEVVLMHGAVQIDEFVGVYEWAGSSLQFTDADKNARYELRLAARKTPK